MKVRVAQILSIVMLVGSFGVCLFIIAPDLCACEKRLKTQKASPSEIAGTYTLILYGHRFLDDIETVVFLDKEGDQYHFEPFAPDFDFNIKKGVLPKEALAKAEKFVSFHSAFWRSELSRILDNNGNVIGYEVRPLYYPWVFGFSDVMDISYFLKKDNTVKIMIRLITSIERSRFPGSGDGLPGGVGH